METGKEYIIKFSHNYPKLQKDKFPTIRKLNEHKYKKYRVFKIVVQNKFLCYAVLNKKQETTIADIPTKFLLYDTNEKSREAAYIGFQKFYINPINYETDIFTVLFFEKIPFQEVKFHMDCGGFIVNQKNPNPHGWWEFAGYCKLCKKFPINDEQIVEPANPFVTFKEEKKKTGKRLPKFGKKKEK